MTCNDFCLFCLMMTDDEHLSGAGGEEALRDEADRHALELRHPLPADHAALVLEDKRTEVSRALVAHGRHRKAALAQVRLMHKHEGKLLQDGRAHFAQAVARSEAVSQLRE